MNEEFFEEFEEEETKKGPLKFMLSIFLIFLIVVWIVPHYGIKIDPRPKEFPSLSEVLEGINGFNYSTRIENFQEVKAIEISPFLKVVSSRVSGSCGNNAVCSSKAFFYFVRDQIDYVSDPNFEYLENPELVLMSGSADCDGKSILVSSLLKTVGIPNRIVLGNNHAYVQAYLPDALKSYKSEDEWVSMDVTCKNCKFGEIFPKYLKNIQEFIYIS